MIWFILEPLLSLNNIQKLRFLKKDFKKKINFKTKLRSFLGLL